ncbi:MAG TPA: type II secretion system protein GspD [Candidatus Omnitrophica bacterium]|nr:type II secretion system protein GspD [Candidatus Omnitrophota bacterium]
MRIGKMVKLKSVMFLALFFLMLSCKVLSQGELISINFEDVDLRVVTNFVSKVTGKNFLLDERVRGKVTIISPTKIPVDEVYRVFLSVLEVKGFTAISSGNVIKIVPATQAKQSPLPTGIGKDASLLAPEDKMVTQLVPLQYADSQQLLAVLSPLISPKGHITSYPPTNTLIMTDISSNIRRILEIINNFDVEGAKIETTIIPLKFASATELSTKITQATESARKTTVAPTRTVRGRRQLLPTPVSGKITLIPDERTNSLIVVANREDTLTVKKLVEKLDIPSPPGRETVHIYYLKNADAEELAKILSAMPLGREVTGKEKKVVNISADKSTNSLIVTAEPHDYQQIKEIIDKLDIVRPQVLVEALIADVAMDTIKELGIEWTTLDEPVEEEYRGFAGTKYSVEQTTLYERGLTFSGLLVGAMKGTTDGIPNVGMIIQAYQSTSGFNILSTPQILTLDNQEAKILVGSNVPFITSSRVTEQDTVVRSYEYRDVGIELTITPHIGKQNLVRLDIHQKVESLVPSTGEAPTTTKREAETTVSVEDGSTIVIGGLIRDDKTEVLHKVPLLGDIPILGLLFRRREVTSERRNLLIFITPHIIREKARIEEITRQRQESLDDFREELKE